MIVAAHSESQEVPHDPRQHELEELSGRRRAAKCGAAGMMRCLKNSWTLAELHAEMDQFEVAARAAGLAETSVRTYVDDSRFFIRWLAGDSQFKGPR
jgi:hypothetical protein